MNDTLQTVRKWLGTGSVNLFGRPFSGKDTQGRLLAKAVQGVLIGGGDILRSHHDPAKVTEVMAHGGLIPSDFYFQLVLPYLSQARFKHKPLILDAVGRASGEEPTVLKATLGSGHALKAVIVLKISEAEVWRRFEAAAANGDRGRRSDDSREVLRSRLQKFHDNTLPVLEFYRQRGFLVEVDGAQSREAVEAEMLHRLAVFATR